MFLLINFHNDQILFTWFENVQIDMLLLVLLH